MSPLEDRRTGKVFDQFKAHGVLEHTEVILPDGTANKWRDPNTLFPALETAEKRRDAHLGYEIVTALPADKDITLDDRIKMATGFVREHITSKGVPAQVSVHRPHNLSNDNDRENYHAHIIVGLRRIEGDDLAKRKERNLFVRHVNVNGHIVVAQAMPWSELWREFQENYFKAYEKEAIVDSVAIHPNEHIGPLRFRHPRDPRIETADKVKTRNAEAARDPDRVFEHLARIKMAEEPIKMGMTRLYRAEVAPEFRRAAPEWVQQAQQENGHEAAKDRWFTDKPEFLDWYLQDIGDADITRITYVDLPTREVEQYRVSNIPEAHKFSRDPENEFFVSREIADRRLVYGAVEAQTQQKFDERALNRFLEKHLPKNERAEVKDAVIKRQQEATAARLQAALGRAERIHGKHKIELVRSETHLDVRRQQMGVVRKVLHSSGVRPDLETEKWEKWKARSERGIERWSIKIKTFSDQLESVQQQINASNQGERTMQSQNSNDANNQRQQQAAAALAREQAELSRRQSPEAVAQQLKQLAAERQRIEHELGAERRHEHEHEH